MIYVFKIAYIDYINVINRNKMDFVYKKIAKKKYVYLYHIRRLYK